VKVTAQDLIKLNRWLRPDRAEEMAKAITNALPMAGITTPRRLRHFIAQLGHESGGFTRLVENMNYKDPARLDDMFRAVQGRSDAMELIRKGPVAIANRVYANRLGNGPESSGDGYRFRGRGLIMLTGRENYERAERWSGLPLLKEPGLAGRPREAAIIAAKYWNFKNINQEADEGDLAGVTRLVNGPALANFEDRKLWLLRASKIWPD
jgi:putative chitinase